LNNFVAFILAALLLAPAIVVAIPVHEIGHALAAYFLGDRSVRYFGYLTANPRRFLDPLGVIAVFVALVGWGRRVPVQPNRISTTGQRVIHELGGPAANLVAAIVLGLLWQFLTRAGMHSTLNLTPGLFGAALYAIVFLNLSIFAFQLLPIPGLDGWAVIEAIFRNRNARFFYQVNSRRQQIWVGCIVVIFLWQLFQGGSLLSTVMTPFYWPASLISMGGCITYAIPGFNGLHPCPQ
jgi:Zn-dependent protease